MLFQVLTTIDIPFGFDPAKLAELSAGERARARELQEQGKWLHIWRVAGRRSSIIIFRVDSADELHSILDSLPFRPFMEAEVTALCHHPNSIEAP